MNNHNPSEGGLLRPSSLRKLSAALAAGLCIAHTATAEDIDLFTSAGTTNTVAPNILIILDNSANWSRNDQAWPTGKQGESELEAIRDLMLAETIDPITKVAKPKVDTRYNIGLMMLTSGAVDGAYVRYAVRNMTPAAKTGLVEMIGAKACTDGANSVTGKANCILKNFDSPSEKTNSASTRYSAALFEAFKYFGGYTDPPRANLDQPGSPVDSTHFGPQRYATLDPKADPAAFHDASMTRYRGPINADGSNSCAKNYIIFIGNGYPSQDNAPTLLSGINGNPNVPPPIGVKQVRSANWAQYLYNTDVSEVLGRQRVATYTIDVFNAKPEADQNALLQGMAKYGGGKYFAAKSKEDIIKALEDILIEIQSVNSVFASASLPINATNRSQNENQVFIGMFRPDPDARPKWYGNLKQYQVSLFGKDAKLADKDGREAIAATTGFVQACATSFYTTDSGNYWGFSAASLGLCTSAGVNPLSDLPDGGVVEKGGTAEVVRKGNDPAIAGTGPFVVKRLMYTCPAACVGLVEMNATLVTMARTGAATLDEHNQIIKFTRGEDVLDENANANVTEPRPTIHGDIAHSRPLPVNYGGSRGVVVYYGANDGTFKAVEGRTGKELWSFVAPEHHAKLRRLFLNEPRITYPNLVIDGARRKDYFFDGSAGVYQNADDTKVWIFPGMRRGGRAIYAFNVTTETPSLMWSFGCPNFADDVGCSAGASGIGQTWSTPNVAFTLGYLGGAEPLIFMGGGYDGCEDRDQATTECTATAKGRRVYILDAASGSVVREFVTRRSVAADVSLIDRDFDGKVDHAYVADTGGSLYRVDLVDPITRAARAPGEWTMTEIAATSGAARKFLFGPAVLSVGDKVYLAVGSGDRERPLINNYPYTEQVQNRFYSVVDSFATIGLPVNLDGPTMMNFTAATDCNTTLAAGKNGWFMDLAAGRGEQSVTGAVIFGGIIFFSTNRPTPPTPGSCATNLGEARGYAVNLLNASGVIGTGALCGGTRSGVFTGGGLPPSPVVGTVPVTDPATGISKPTSVIIGGIDLKTGSGSAIAAQAPPPPIQQIRSRVFWYPHGDK